MRLRAKPRRLILGVVELREPVRKLAPADEELEAIGHERIGVVAARERRHLGGILRDEHRSLQRRLDGLLEEVVLQLARAVLRSNLDAVRGARDGQHRSVADAPGELGIRALERSLDRNLGELRAEIDALALILDASCRP